MGGIKHGNTIKRSISLGADVNAWAEAQAKEAGYGNNFSAFVTKLVADARNREKVATLGETRTPYRVTTENPNSRAVTKEGIVNDLVNRRHPKGPKPQ